jgi:peptide/nickel transport system permease protein
MRFIARRLMHSLLLLVGISLVSFLFADVAPGDILSETRLDPRVSPSAMAAMRSQFGLDRPLAARYSNWAASVLKETLDIRRCTVPQLAPCSGSEYQLPCFSLGRLRLWHG